MRWADYSAGRPGSASLKAAGFGGVIRYIGLGAEGKQINATEYQDHLANGVQVLLVGELGTEDAWGSETDDDYARGRYYAQVCLDDARAQGIPDSVGIACAADAHAQTYQIDDVLRYCQGFESVLGRARTGFYGFYETLGAVKQAGLGSWYWRCGSEPSSDEKNWVNFWQRNAAPTQITVQGVDCDINEQYQPVVTAPAPHSIYDDEDEMQPVTLPPSAEEAFVSEIWDGRAAVLNVICASNVDGFAGAPKNWGPNGGTGPSSRLGSGWTQIDKVEVNRPAQWTVAAGTTRVFFGYSCSGPLKYQILPV